MTNNKLLVVLIIVLTASVTNAVDNNNTENWNGELNHWEKKECICPNTTVAAASNEDKRKTINSVVSTILDTPIANLTMLGSKFRGILKDMLASPMDNFRQFAALNANWLSSQLPYLDQKPSGCPMAQLINATAACLADQDGSKMASALDNVATQLSSGASLLISTSIAASGCKPPWTAEKDSSTNTVPKYECAKDGFVYRIRSTWQQLGSDFPYYLRDTVLMMYRSDDYLDKFLAAIATFSLTPSFNNYFVNWPFELAFESVSLQNSPPIPECCCEERLKRINELANLNQHQTILQTQGEKNNYASKWACWPKPGGNNINGGGGAVATSSAGGNTASSSAGGGIATGSAGVATTSAGGAIATGSAGVGTTSAGGALATGTAGGAVAVSSAGRGVAKSEARIV